MLAVLPFSVMMLTISPADFLHPLCLCVQAVEASPGDVDASPADKEKVFDAVAAAQAEKEKKQAMKEQADARKQEKEMEECTFKPALSRKSLDMLAQVRLFLSSSSPLPRPLFLFPSSSSFPLLLSLRAFPQSFRSCCHALLSCTRAVLTAAPDARQPSF